MNRVSTSFAPKGESTIAIAAGPVSQSREVNPGPGRARRLRLLVEGDAMVFVELTGPGGSASPLHSMPLLPGSVSIVTAAGSHLAAVTAGGSAMLYVTPGEGA
ncbi:MAG: hypothetical protein KIT20_06710 [Alphaproteobacteria bacterium]|nr:hypothetical protein [Alphaproteobacteria bacterium]